MTKLDFQELIVDKSTLDVTRICRTWSWLLGAQEDLAYISLAGDLFFTGVNGEISWLETGSGELVRVADNTAHFEELCLEEEYLEYWFLSNLIRELMEAGKLPGKEEVYGCHLMPMLGGEYTVENYYPLDLYTHFELTGLICESTKDLPDSPDLPEPVI